MQIAISTKVKKVLIVIGISVILGIAFFAIRPLLFHTNTQQINEISPDAQSAVDATTIFYTLNYTEDPNLWVTRICKLSTEAGCHALRNFYAFSVLAMVEKNHIQTYSQVIPIRLVSENGNVHLWQVRVTLTHPWPGLDKPVQDVFVEVEKVKDSWLLNRILFQQEASQFITPTP